MERSALVLASALLALTPALAPAQEAVPGGRVVDEILVTAQKREEHIQDVPLAVTALSDARIERAGVKDLRALPTLSASFHMNAAQTEPQGSVLRIRGVGTTGNNIGLESSVGVFLDDVYLSRPGIALSDLADLRSIEILRGPQATLFGRNTSAGALVIRSKQPDLDRSERWLDGEIGNFDSSSIRLGGSAPLVEGRLGVRGSAAIRRRSGFVTSTTGAESMDRDRMTLRGQLLWAISDQARLRLIGDYSEADEQCCDAPIVVESPIVADGAFAAAGLPADGGVPVSGSEALENRISNSQQFESPFEQWGISARLDWDLGVTELTYIGAYRAFTAESVQFDFVGIDVFSVRPEVAGGQRSFDDIDTSTHELRLSGENGRLEWMIGGFFLWEDIVEGQGVGLGEDFTAAVSASSFFGAAFPLFGGLLEGLADVPLATGGTFEDVLRSPDPARSFAGGVDAAGAFAQNRFNQTTRAWSLFTHNTLRLTERVNLVFGLRWVEEDKDGRFEQFDAENQACLNSLANAQALNEGAEGSGLEFFADATGRLASGPTCFPFASPADTGSRVLPRTFDLGFSDEALLWTLRAVYRFNANTIGYAGFTHGFKSGGFNLDPTAAIRGADPRFASETVDAWEVGLKSDLLNRRLRVNTALFHQSLDDFQVLDFAGIQFETFNVPKAESRGIEVELQAMPPVEQLDLGLSVTYLDARYPGDCDGNDPDAPAQVSSLCGARLTNAPDWAGVFTMGWDDRLPGTAFDYFLHSHLRWESKRRTSIQPIDPDSGELAPADFQDANAKVNLRVGLAPRDGRWAFELWADNVFDEQTRNLTANVTLRGVGVIGTAARGAFIEAPRTFGAAFRMRM